jgi:N-acetyl-1-D-myo-inositol-2-amino-2-deoxy-alpha-D-glucopyranoside deacetylase
VRLAYASWRARLAANAVALALASWIAPGSAIAQPATPTSLDLSRGTRLLVVSPHPDDGVIGGGGLIQRVLSLGGAVRVVQITSGDAFSTGVKVATHTDRPTASDYRRYGALRERESAAAMATLGVRRANLLMLGFPDDGLCELAPDRRAVDAAAFESPYTKRSSPPRSEQLLSRVAYRGEDLERELRQIVSTFKPTLVLIPDPRDEHPDHCTTHLWVHEALDAMGAGPAPITPVLLHYLVHYRRWPSSGDARAAALAPPAPLVALGSEWKTLALTARERAAKRRALGQYASQVLAIGPFLDGFDRPNELFLEAEPEGHAACWCRGEDVAPTRRAFAHRTATAKQ